MLHAAIASFDSSSTRHDKIQHAHLLTHHHHHRADPPLCAPSHQRVLARWCPLHPEQAPTKDWKAGWVSVEWVEEVWVEEGWDWGGCAF